MTERPTRSRRSRTWLVPPLLALGLALILRQMLGRTSLSQDLMMAVYANDAPAAEAALDRGADPNCIAYGMSSASMWERMFNALRGRRDQSGMPVLMEAARSNEWPIVKALVLHGADPNIEGYGNPLERAAAGNEEVARLLLAHGADPRLGAPLEVAIAARRYGLMRELLKRGAPARGGQGSLQTPLATLALVDVPGPEKLDAARELLSHGADPNEGSALTTAASRNDLAFARLLLDRGADPNGAAGARMRIVGTMPPGPGIGMGPGPGLADWLPLWAAANAGQAEMVRLLLDRGADPTLTDRRTGRTPAQEAALRPFSHVAAILRKAEVDWRRKHPAGAGH